MTAIKRIMCIEDDLDIQFIIQCIFEMENIEFLLSDDGRKAVAMAFEFKPDAILLDVMMPNCSGQTTLKNLQADPRTAGVPVIFMSACIQPQEVRDYLALGVRGVIAKPFDPITLIAQVRIICEESDENLAK